MKLIIDIPEESYEYIKTMSDQGWLTSPEYANATRLTCSDYAHAIKNGTPLDDVKAEIKVMFPPSGNWMYDEECEHEHTVCEVLSDVLQILDNIGKAESEEE